MQPESPSDGHPLTETQAALVALARLYPDGRAYHLAQAYRLAGPVDPRLLQRALDRTVDRHPVLRSRVRAGDDPQGGERAVFDAAPIVLRVADLADGGEPSGIDARLRARIASLLDEPFDVETGPLLRTALFRLAPELQVVVAVAHHLVTDGLSQAVFWSDWFADHAALAADEARPSDPQCPGFAEHARADRERLAGAEAGACLAAWRARLATVPALALPAPSPGTDALAGSDAGEGVGFTLAPAVTVAVRALAARLRATPFVVLLAAFESLLERHCGQSAFVVGTPIAGRPPGYERTIGYFAQMALLCADFSDDPSFTQLVERVGAQTRAVLSQPVPPLPRLAAALRAGEGGARPPPCRVAFAVELASEPPQIPGVDVLREPVVSDAVPFDLSLVVAFGGDQAEGRLRWRTGTVARSFGRGLAKRYPALLARLVATPDARLSCVPTLDDDEARQVLCWSRGPDTAPSTPFVTRLFEDQVDRTPDAPAIIADDGRLTYRALDRRVDHLAARLRRLGVVPDTAVAVCCADPARAAIATLAVLKAGGGVLPLDPLLPPARIAFMLADAACAVVLAGSAERLLLPADGPTWVSLDATGVLGAEPAGDADPAGGAERVDPAALGLTGDSLAYLIYTSGSSGQPKAVMSHHRGLTARVPDRVRLLDLGPGSRYLRLASAGFDVSLLEICVALTSGAALCTAPRPALTSRDGLLAGLTRFAITHASIPPALLALLPEDAALPALRAIVCGGESCPPSLAEVWSRRVRLVHAYGPTEAAIVTVAAVCEPAAPWRGGGPLPIGRPVPNASAYLLDAHDRLVPEGVIGQIHLGGVGVARGYLHRPDLTAERFVPDPFAAGGWMYRSGDLARWLPDGVLQWLGRSDDQVKIHGHRIELAEIEAVLGGAPDVAEAVVVAPVDADGRRRLVGFVRPREGASTTAAELRRFLLVRLPPYMVPTPLRLPTAWPKLANGKVDRQALLRQATEAGNLTRADVAGGGPVAPLTAAEARLAAIWADVLGRPITDGQAEFLLEGGDSLAAMRLAARIAAKYGTPFGVRDVFEHGSLAAMAARLDAAVVADPARARDAPAGS
ncbi:MAG: amino acid adenylation domain-containing protein [Lautropia sp.]